MNPNMGYIGTLDKSRFWWVEVGCRVLNYRFGILGLAAFGFL